jgi:hypothetical protein
VLHEYAKANDKLVIRGGAMANLVMEPKAVAQLATMPSREELLSMLLGTMQAPIATFVRTLNEVPGRSSCARLQLSATRRKASRRKALRCAATALPATRQRIRSNTSWQFPKLKSSTPSPA